eukprot:TRINITY_DN1166_c0_g1_i1.p1 TRINITY_DN1166_c0_g1~~TRINITY_DN1166_c0_g1_i1.p1  ORF type:complete len:665 (-),score=269.02 TRINITY_DN1166_c0_g1_i1:92-2086(-)
MSADELPPSLSRTQSQTNSNGKKPKKGASEDGKESEKISPSISAVKNQDKLGKRGSLDSSPPRSPLSSNRSSTFHENKNTPKDKKKTSGFWSFFTGKGKEKEKEPEKKNPKEDSRSFNSTSSMDQKPLEKAESDPKELESAINKNLIIDEKNPSNNESKEYNLSPEEVEALEKSRISPDGKRRSARERQLRFPCSCVEDLPKDLKKLAKGTKISDDILDANLQSLLNVLHFVTKKVYISSSHQSGSTKLVKELEHKVDSSDGVSTPRPRKVSANLDSSSVPHNYSSSEAKSKEGSQDNSLLFMEDSGGSKGKEEEKDDNKGKEEKKDDDGKKEEVSGDKPVEEPTMKKSNSSLKPRETSSTPSIKRSASKAKPTEPLDIIKNTNPKDTFKNLKKAGKGGFGTVFGAKSLIDGRKVAVKKMTHATRKERLDNFNEYRYTQRCSGHSNIVKMVSAYDWKEECWLIMEFLEGGTLTEARRGHEFEENEIAFVARELLRGISHIHSLGLIHRDVKSENIMMSINGDIKLIDFGLCIENNLVRPTMVGSPFWMPPEMINRQQHSYAADIWSFGISLLELANKNPPGSYNKVKMMFLTATVGKPKPLDTPDKWSPEFHDFIGRCLEKEQEKRALTEELLAHKFIEKASNTRRVMQKILSEIFLQKAIGLM